MNSNEIPFNDLSFNLNDIINLIKDNKTDKLIYYCYEENKEEINYNFDLFLNALKTNNSIKELTILFTELTQENFEKLCDFMINNKTITKLSINNNDIHKYYSVINENFKSNINSLNIFNNNQLINKLLIDDEEFNTYKEQYYLVCNNIQKIINKRISSLCNMIENNNTLEQLHISLEYNSIFIDSLLKNKSITKLNLYHVKNLDFNQVINLLNNKTLKSLYFSIKIKPFDIQLFKDFCESLKKNNCLETLKLYSVKENKIPKDQIKVIQSLLLDSLINNKSIRILAFNKGFITRYNILDFDLIINLLQNNNRITELYFNKKYNNLYEKMPIKNINKFLIYLQSNKTLKNLEIYLDESDLLD